MKRLLPKALFANAIGPISHSSEITCTVAVGIGPVCEGVGVAVDAAVIVLKLPVPIGVPRGVLGVGEVTRLVPVPTGVLSDEVGLGVRIDLPPVAVPCGEAVRVN